MAFLSNGILNAPCHPILKAISGGSLREVKYYRIQLPGIYAVIVYIMGKNLPSV